MTAIERERFEHAIALRDAGRVEDALQALAGLTESTTDPEGKASLLLSQSRCLLMLGRYKEARQQLALARRIAPKNQGLLYLEFAEANLFSHEGDWDKALNVIASLQRDYGELLQAPEHRGLSEQVQILRGAALVACSRFREARTVLEGCVSYHLSAEDERQVLSNLGICYENLGEPDRGKQVLLEALRKGLGGSSAVSAHYYLGTIYHAEKAYAKALTEFEWCLAHIDEGKIPKKHIYQWLASTATTLGMKEDAHRYRSLSESG